MKGQRPIIDVLGILLHVNVHAANKNDTLAAFDALSSASEKYPSILAYLGDAGYRGTSSVKFTDEKLNLTLYYFSEKLKDIWVALPEHWLVVRTFS